MDRLPAAHFGRFITFAEISRTSEVPVDTLVSWHRYARAAGFELGRKHRAVWNFSPHEFYQLNALGTLSRSGFPVGIDAIRQVLAGTASEARPTGSLFLTTPSTFAIIAIDLRLLWDCSASILQKMEAAHAE